MNIKSLLLGSAAALAAVSGARAADAVTVAEPEAVEYVRVCDTYGTGFFYIPGTETCLRVSGRIRYDMDYSNRDDTIVPAVPAVVVPGAAAPIIITPAVPAGIIVNNLDDGFSEKVQAHVAFDARSETEFGTFTRFIRIGTSALAGVADQTELEYAWISLGGLLFGKNDSLYDTDMGPEFDGGFGGNNVQIRYTADFGSGFTGAISFEENTYNQDFDPKLVAMLGLSQGWGGASIYGAYDGDTDEYFVKGYLTFNATDMFTLEATAGYESGFSSLYSIAPNVSSGSYPRGYEWFVGGAVTGKFTPKLAASIGAQGFFNSHATGSDDYVIGGQIQYQLVDNLLARVTVDHYGGDTEEFEQAKFRLEATF